MIAFTKVPHCEKLALYLNQAINSGRLSGDNTFTLKCNAWIEEKTKTKKAFLVPSGTHALEMTALLADIREGDEVIMPSYTFSSTANAFVLRGAKIVFVDIRPDTMNIDEKLIESAITLNTKAIAPVHYAGVGCNMDVILDIAARYDLIVIEDAAQGMMAEYKNKALGSIGNLGVYSFHETKNYTCGEGGAILINDERLLERAEIIREKGTDRTKFFRGQIDKYSWRDIGSSYLISELCAAFLYGQLEIADEINSNRKKTWDLYLNGLKFLNKKGDIELAVIPPECKHNAHMFYIKVNGSDERTKLLTYLNKKGVYAVFHYIPLHNSVAGKKYGRFAGSELFTEKESERIIRLPLYYGISTSDVEYVIEMVYDFFKY